MSWSHLLRRFGYRLWQLLVLFLILLALGVSFLRLLAPHASHIKPSLQQWFENHYQLRLDYQSLELKWYRFGLYLTLNRVDIDPLEGEDKIKQVKSLSVRFEPWKSLSSQRLRLGEVRIEGVEIELSPAAQQGDESSLSWQELLKELISNRFEEFELIDAQLHLKQQESRKTLVLPAVRWRNQEHRHQAEGSAHLLGFPEQAAGFMVDIHNAPGELFKGELYLDVANLSPHPFVRFLAHEAVTVKRSELNFKLWLDFNQKELLRARLNLGTNRVNWQHRGNQESQQFLLDAGDLVFQRLDSGWQLFSHGLQAQTNGVDWPSLKLNIENKNSVINGSLNQLELGAIMPLLGLYPGLAEPLAELADQTAGGFNDLRWQSDGQDWLLTGSLNKVGWQQTEQIPGIEQLNGSFELSSAGLKASLQAPEQVIQPGDQFPEPIQLLALDAVVELAQHEQGWQLNIPQFALETSDLSLNLSGRLQQEQQESPELYLYGEMALSDLAKAWHYFPEQGMTDSLKAYLKRALQAGHVSGGQLLWHGAFADFPYQQGAGIFQVDVPTKEARFAFNPEWPALDPLDMTLSFENRDLVITATKAWLKEVEIIGLTASIPGLREDSLLTITGDLKAKGEAARAVFDNSSLADSLGVTLNKLNLSGPVSGPLELAIPLDGKPVQVKGYSDLADAAFTIPGTAEHWLTQANGRIYFEQGNIHIENLIASYQDMPVSLNLTGTQLTDSYQVQARLEGEWLADALARVPGISLPSMAGDIEWQGSVNADVAPSGVTTKIVLTSDLKTLDVKLPEPLAKPEQVSWPARVNIEISPESIMTGRAVVGNKLYAMWQQALGGPVESDYLWLGLGTQQPLKGTPSGTTLDMQLPHLDVTAWLNLPSGEGSGTLFDQGTWRLEQLTLQGYQLKQPELNFQVTPEQWLVDVHTPDSQAELLFTTGQDKKLRVKARDLELTAAEAEQPKPESSAAKSGEDEQQRLAAIPALDIHCLQCRVGELFFDELKLISTTNTATGQWIAEEAWFKSGNGKVVLEQLGWQLTDKLSQSQVMGRIQAPDMDELSRSLLPESVIPIRDSNVEGSFSFVWNGAPQDFDLKKLAGSFEWTLGEGHLAEVSDKGARVFSLLSMDSLVRKIRLDFSDVFDKGLFYNEMSGSFVFDKGVIRSDAIEMDGVAGDMSIQGHTSLIDRSMDYDVVFNPDLTSSLPLLAGLTINPVTGIYVLALHTVMKPVVEVVTQIRFKVSGTIDEPVVTEVGRSKKEIKVEQAKPVPDEKTEPTLQAQTSPPEKTEPQIAQEPQPDTVAAPVQQPKAEPEKAQSEQQENPAPATEEQPLVPELPAAAPITVGGGKR